MADVRSLLRNERAQRRITHPLSTYSATGTLECTVCHIPVKSEQEIWNKHLKSTQHAMRQERLRLATSRPKEQAAPRQSNVTKKRKAEDIDDVSRKKGRPIVGPPGGSFDEVIEANNASIKKPLHDQTTNSKAQQSSTKTLQEPEAIPSQLSQPSQKADPTPINEDEWAAFERDVATPPPNVALPSALTAEATISAAPLTAAELAAQSREQNNQQAKDQRDAEIEGEKEDAARALEEEFDEMEGLEERVARLRRMREELRAKSIIEREDKEDKMENEDRGDGLEEVEDSDDEDDFFRW